MISARYLCLLLVVGCATPMSALREDNRRLSQTVSALRSDRRAQDHKIADLQHQLDALRAKVVTGAIDSAVPVLPVEVAGPAVSLAPAAPGAARVVGVTDDGTEIVYEGDAAIGRPAALPPASPASPASDDDAPALRRTPASSRTAAASQPLGEVPVTSVPATADRIEVMRRIPPISARVATRTKTREHEAPSDRNAAAANEYRAAVELVKTARYEEALVALRAFIAKYPHHDYADNAQYWVGEVLYAQKDYARALTEFRAVIEVYPRGNKVPDALLKMGYCYQAIGQGEKARAVLEQVVNLYPKSEPAMLAGKRLEPR